MLCNLFWFSFSCAEYSTILIFVTYNGYQMKIQSSCLHPHVVLFLLNVLILNFQEGYELAQRKFMRQISLVASRMDTAPYPRLCVLDYQSEADTVSHHYSHTPDDQRSTNQVRGQHPCLALLPFKSCSMNECDSRDHPSSPTKASVCTKPWLTVI